MLIYEPFVYEPLPEDGESIRLLKVLQGLGPQEVLQCELTHATTSDEYTALSYTWGSASEEHEILINDKLLNIRPNLWQFLKRVSLSPDYAAKAFWIDAVCYQSDDREKSLQVARMSEIYASAAHVLIWLSPPPVPSSAVHTITYAPIQDFEQILLCLPDQDRRRIAPECTACGDCSTLIWTNCIRQLIAKHDYWKRVWIVQEFLLKKQRTILYACFAIPWEVYEAFQTFHEVSQRANAQKLKLFDSSWLAVLTSPFSLISLTLSSRQEIIDYITDVELDFTAKTGLPLPGPARSSSQRAPFSPLVRWLSHYAPKILANVISWRPERILEIDKASMEMLRARANERGSANPRFSSKSEFFLFMKSLGHMSCSDQRDRIYGLMAMMVERHSFTVDYSIDSNELFFRALHYFTSRQYFSQEPCVLAPELLPGALLDIMKINLVHLTRDDVKRRSSNLVLVPHSNKNTSANKGLTESNQAKLHAPIERDVHEFEGIYEKCTEIAINAENEGTKIPCLHCGRRVTFESSRLLKLLELQGCLDSFPPQSETVTEVVVVLQCHFSSSIKPSSQHEHHDCSDGPYFEHLIFYKQPNSKPTRFGAMLDAEGMANYKNLVSKLSAQTLKATIEYMETLSEAGNYAWGWEEPSDQYWAKKGRR